ncbi:MAG: hypothetical protein RMJ46_09125, partial [Bacteroidota bacterium]|nr:hypothetical protein [Bacteroidota bacterium]
GRRCECGFEPRYRYSQEELEVLGGVLEEVVDGKRGGGALWDEESRRLFYLQLLHYAREKGKKDGWAAHVYRERWGVWPKWEWRFLPTVPPSPDVNRYIISRWIRWSRSKKRLWNLGSW